MQCVKQALAMECVHEQFFSSWIFSRIRTVTAPSRTWHTAAKCNPDHPNRLRDNSTSSAEDTPSLHRHNPVFQSPSSCMPLEWKMPHSFSKWNLIESRQCNCCFHAVHLSRILRRQIPELGELCIYALASLHVIIHTQLGRVRSFFYLAAQPVSIFSLPPIAYCRTWSWK